MRHPFRQPGAAHRPTHARREGFVLVAVLLVVVVLALAAYQFSESMAAEYIAADSFQRVGQARALAKSAIDYSMVMLSSPDNFTNTLASNPFDNTAAFQHIVVQDNEKPRFRGAFDIVAPYDYDSQQTGLTGYRYGVIDEASKININALFKLDSSGQILINFLMTLPNMTEDVANSIVDWIDPDDDPRDNGAESDYYSGLSPAYQAKNAPLDSIEELLLVKGVTPQLLFGNDQNRNGVLDPGEDDGTGTLNQGWSAFITVFSRERNISSQAIPRINVNSADLSSLLDQLSSAVGEPTAVYIIGYRLFSGGAAGSSGSGSGSSGGGGGGGNAAGGAGGQIAGGGNGGRGAAGFAAGGGAAGGRAAGGGAAGGGAAGGGAARGGGAPTGAGGGSQAGMAVNRMSMATGQGSMGMAQSAVNGRNVTLSATGQMVVSGSSGGGSSTPATTVATGPLTRAQLGDLTNPSTQPASISSLYSLINSTITVPSQNGQSATYSSPLNDKATLGSTLPLMLDQLTTQGVSEIPARLNINTASQVLLAALPGLSAADVETIVSQRPSYTGGAAADPMYQTPAWLMTQANFSASTMQGIDRYITGTSQVYRVQGLGYFDGGGPTARVEAVVDTNAGRPRLMYWRDLTELGKGYTPQPVQ